MKTGLPLQTNLPSEISQPDIRRICAEIKLEIRRGHRWVVATLILLYGILLPLYMWIWARILGFA